MDGGRSSVAAEERLDHCCACVVDAPLLDDRRVQERVAAEVTARLALLLLLRRVVVARKRLCTTFEGGADWMGEVRLFGLRLFGGDVDELATDLSSDTLTSFNIRCVSFSNDDTGMWDNGAAAVAARRLFFAIFGKRVDDDADLVLEARRPRPRRLVLRWDFRERFVGLDGVNEYRGFIRLLSLPSSISRSWFAFFSRIL